MSISTRYFHTTADFGGDIGHLNEFVDVIDSLGRRWNPAKHPRDAHGRFIRTFSSVKFNMPGSRGPGTAVSGRALGVDRDGSVLVYVTGVGPNAPEGVQEGSYVKVPHDQVEVQTIKAQLGGKRNANDRTGRLMNQEAASVTKAISSLRTQGMDDDADKLQEALDLSMEDVDAVADPAGAQAKKDRAIDLYREVGESVSDELGKNFNEGDDLGEVMAAMPNGDAKARLQALDSVIKTTFTARQSVGGNVIEGWENDQGVIKGKAPKVRLQAAQQQMAKDAANGAQVIDITSGSAVETALPQPTKATLPNAGARDTVREQQGQNVLPELQVAMYQKPVSGRNRLTGFDQAQQVAPADRWHVDKDGKTVAVGSVVHVDKATKGQALRPEFSGVITRVHTDKNGRKTVKVRQYNPDAATDGTGKPYKDWEVTSDVMGLATEDQRGELAQQLALLGKSPAAKSLAEALSAEFIDAQQRRFASPGATRISPTGGSSTVIPVQDRVKVDANGEKIKVDDKVFGPNGEYGTVTWVASNPNDNAIKVEYPNGQTTERLTGKLFTRAHGPTSATTLQEGAEYNDNNYVPTREEAAADADAMGATDVAEAIRSDGDYVAIQKAMRDDAAFQAALPDVAQLYADRNQALAAGQAPDDTAREELAKWDRMAAASAGQFREPSAPPPTPPTAPVPDTPDERPQNPANPTEHITPEGVPVREEDGNVIVGDDTEEPIPADDTAAVEAKVSESAGTKPPPDATTPEQAAPEAAAPPSLAGKVADDITAAAEEAKTGPNVDAIQRTRIDKHSAALKDAVAAQDADAVVKSLRDMQAMTNQQVNANLRNTKLAGLLNGRATGGVPMADFLQARLDAGQDIFSAGPPAPVQARPDGAPDVTPEGVEPAVDQADAELSEALLSDDGSARVMVGEEVIDEGFYVVDPDSIAEFDVMPTEEDVTNFLADTAGSDFEGVSVWFDEADGKYRMARVSVHGTSEAAAEAAATIEANQFVDIVDGSVHNVALGGDVNEATPEFVEDPRSEARSTRTAGEGKATARTTAKQKKVLDVLSGGDAEMERIAQAIKNGDEISGDEAINLADFVAAMDVSQFDSPSDKGVVTQMADRLARAAGATEARGYPSKATALRRTSDTAILLDALSGDDGVRSLTQEARTALKNDDYVTAAAKFRAAADAYDELGLDNDMPSRKAVEHADRLDASTTTVPATPRAAPAQAPPVQAPAPQAPAAPEPAAPAAPEAPAAPAAPEPAAPSAPEPAAPATPEPAAPNGLDVNNLPSGWSAIVPGSSHVIRHQDGSMIITNPDGTYTAVKPDGTTSQFDTPEDALASVGGQAPADTTPADDESAEVGLINPGASVPFDFSRAADDASLSHTPTGNTITTEPAADQPFVLRDEDGAVLGRFATMDRALDAAQADAEEDGGSGSPLEQVLSTHPSRDFMFKKGKPARDKKTGKPLTPTQARANALRAAGKLQGREWFGSGNFHAVVGTHAVKAKVISGDREGFELDPSETDLFAALATQIQQSNVPQSTKDRVAELMDPTALTGKRMFVDAKGGAILAVDTDGRMIGPFTGNNAALRGNHGDAQEQLTKKAVRGGGRYATTAGDDDADALAKVGLKATHHMTDGTMVYQYDPERVGEKYDPSTTVVTPDLAAALADHAQWRADYEANPFHIALDQGEMGDAHVRVDVPDIDPKTGQQRVDADGNPLNYSKKGPWGLNGASGLIVRSKDPKTGEDRFLMVQRSKHIGNSYKWQFGGGAINSNETGEQGAAREFFEETQPPAGWLSTLTHVGTNTTTNQQFNWNYANVAADAPTMFDPTLDYESADAQWLTRQEIADLEVNGDLLPAVAASIRDSLSMFGGTPAQALPQGVLRPKPAKKGGRKGEPDVDQPTLDVPEPGAPEAPEAPEAPRAAEPPAAVPTDKKTFVRPAGGSNGAGYYDVEMSDGSTQRYVVKKLKPESGRQEAAASAFYRRLGIDAPEVFFNEDESALYSKVVEGVSEAQFNPQQIVAMRDGFATDAWLAAWDIRMGDNTLLTRDGKPVRIDNGGTMEYRAQGAKKGSGGTVAFGNTVGELDTFRDGKTQASQIYGKRGRTPDGWEADSAQRVVDLPDDDIRAIATEFNLPGTLADTLIARKNDIAARYSLTPTPQDTSLADALSKAAEDANHPTGSVKVIENTTPASPAAVQAGTAGPLTHDKASAATKWGEDKDRANLLPVASVGDAHTLTMSDGTTRDYAVSAPKTPDQGQRVQLASALYNELGVATPAADYDAAENNLYTELTQLGPDRGTAGYDDVRAGFVLDAWLGNLRIGSKHIAYGPDGTPIRTDLRYVLGGAKTPLDPKGVASTLDGLRNPSVNQHAANLFGTRSGGFDDFEYDGAQEVLSIPDDRIRELVANAGLDSTMADTLIARRDGIADYYGLVDPSAPVPAKSAYAAVNAAESLREAKRGLTNVHKQGYVLSHMPDGSTYVDVLKSNRGLENAFDTLWRENNPDKPDWIRGTGAVSDLSLPATWNQRDGDPNAHRASRSVNGAVDVQHMVNTLLQFDMSADARKEAAVNWTNGNPRAQAPSTTSSAAVFQAIVEQRGFDAVNPEAEWDDYLNLLGTTHTQVFRTVTPGEGLTDIQVMESHKTGAWRGGNGGKAAGTGLYVSEALEDSNSYGPYGAWLDFAFDIDSANITTPQEMQQAIQKINNWLPTSNLSQDEKASLKLLMSDAGTMAAALGYDAVYGNDWHMPYADRGKGGTYGAANYNILNRGLVTFHKQPPQTVTKTQSHNMSIGGSGKKAYSKWWGAGQGVREPEVYNYLGWPTTPSAPPPGAQDVTAPGAPQGDAAPAAGGPAVASAVTVTLTPSTARSFFNG